MINRMTAPKKHTGARSRRWPALVVAVAVLAGLTGGQSVAHAQATEEANLNPIILAPAAAVLVGEPFEVEAWYLNYGPGAADDFAVTVEVPEGWSVALSGEEDGRTCEIDPSARVVRCQYGTFPGYGNGSLFVSVTPPASGVGTGTLVVTLETSSPETDEYPNEDSLDIDYVDTGVDVAADSATHEPAVTRVGDSGLITWTFRNETPRRLVRDLTATVDLPPGTWGTLRLVNPWSEPEECVITPGPRTVSCTAPGTWDGSEYTVLLDVAYAEPGSYPFTVTMTQSSEEQAPGDETLTHTVEVEERLPGLWLDATASADEVTVGDAYSYVVVVGNDGGEPQTDFWVSDGLPANTRPLSATVGWDGRPCDVVWNSYACHFDRLSPGSTTFIVVRAQATGPGTVANDPLLDAPLFPNPSVVRAPFNIEVVEPGAESPTDLALTATPPAGPVVAGEPVTTVVEITNSGTREATDVALRLDGDPANLEVVSATQGWFQLDCATDGATVCTIPAIYAGGSTFVEVTTRPLAPGPFGATLAVGSETVELSGEAVAGS